MRHDIVFNRRGCCKFPYVHAPWLYEFLIDFAVTENSVRVAGKVLGLSILIKESLLKNGLVTRFFPVKEELGGRRIQSQTLSHPALTRRFTHNVLLLKCNFQRAAC